MQSMCHESAQGSLLEVQCPLQDDLLCLGMPKLPNLRKNVGNIICTGWAQVFGQDFIDSQSHRYQSNATP